MALRTARLLAQVPRDRAVGEEFGRFRLRSAVPDPSRLSQAASGRRSRGRALLRRGVVDQLPPVMRLWSRGAFLSRAVRAPAARSRAVFPFRAQPRSMTGLPAAALTAALSAA